MNTEVPRDRYGRPWIVGPDNATTAYTRISKYAQLLSDSYALGVWQEGMVAKGLTENRYLLPHVESAVQSGDSKALAAVCAVAKEKAGAHDKASYGTDLHALTDAWDRGEEFKWPSKSDPRYADLMAYIDTMESAGITIVASERFVVDDHFQTAGTFDRLLSLGGHGTSFVGDLKTGRIDIDPLKFAMQFALYANANYYHCTHEGETPTKEACTLNPILHSRLPTGANRRWALLMHLPAEQGKCELYWVDLQAGLDACDLALEVKASRKRKDILTPFNPDDPPF